MRRVRLYEFSKLSSSRFRFRLIPRSLARVAYANGFPMKSVN